MTLPIIRTTATLNYVPKTYPDIFLDLMLNAFNVGLLSEDSMLVQYVTMDTKDIENTLILELSVKALMISEKIYDDLTTVHDSRNLNQATGNDLDVVLQWCLERRPASFAVTDLVVGIEVASAENIDFELGTAFMCEYDESIIFTTTENASIIAGQTSVTIPIMCTETGNKGNVLANSITQLVVPRNDIDTVTNPHPATGGKDVESDESFRARGKNWKYILAKGTYDAIVEAITSVASVVGFYVHRYWDGYGTTKLIIDPPAEVTLGAVRDAVDAVKAVDEDITTVGVETVPVNINMEVNVSIDEPVGVPQPEKDLVEAKVRQYLKIYLDGGNNVDGTTQPNLGIGNDFIPFQAEKYLATQIPEIKNITTSQPTSPITIQSHEKATAIGGTITVKVV